MDPNLFHLNGERLIEVFFAIVILAFILERALAVLFEHRSFVNRAKGKGLKEIIAFSLAALVCWYWEFDALSILFPKEHVTIYGELITAAVIAGGSKASIKLFRDVIGAKSTAQAAKDAENKEEPKQ